MKKITTTPEYIRKQKRKLESINRKLQISKKRKKKRKSSYNEEILHEHASFLPPTAPGDFRLIENTVKCLLFFREIRNENNIFLLNKRNVIHISLKDIEKIDYSAICVLKAIVNDLKYRHIFTQCDFPTDPKCKKYLLDSDFLNDFYEKGSHKFKKSEKSDLIVFEKGSGQLSNIENRKIGDLVKNVIKYLTGEAQHFTPVKTILLEICGNSIEHADSKDKHWLLGVEYGEGKVIFTVTDVGKGILETLHRKVKQGIVDIFTNKSDVEILEGAFNQKYGSSTKEVNRNKGLPAVKERAKNKAIINLIVLTNNVVLHFDNKDLSQTFSKGSPRFKGTSYQWEMTKECIEKTNNDSNENN